MLEVMVIYGFVISIKLFETKLTTDDVDQLLKSSTLTPFQKTTLQDALTDGTHTREHVLQANRKSQPKDILKLFRDGNMDKKILFEALNKVVELFFIL